MAQPGFTRKLEKQTMILISTPFDPGKNIGQAYNRVMEMLPSDHDWAVLRDIDTLFLDNKDPLIIQSAIEMKPDTGMFTCYASRTGRGEQKYLGSISPDPNIINHRKIALQQRQGPIRFKEIRRPIAGYCMILQKKTWKDLGGFKEKGLLSIDLDFTGRLLESGRKILLIENLYLFHYYRLMEGGVNYKEHLK